MKIQEKITKILLNCIPIVLMIGLVPIVQDDYLLMGIYVLIITVALLVRYEEKDFLSLIFGFIVMTIAEYFFISMGVEIFTRNSFLGIMPFWLPFLWAYAFVAIKRGIIILNK